MLFPDQPTGAVVEAVVLAEPTSIVEKVVDVVLVIASAKDEVTAIVGESVVN